MPKLFLTDDTILEVEYNKAAKIMEVLKGEKEPDNQEQADFITKVSRVEFANIGVGNGLSNRRGKIEHDEKMDEILADEKLNGRQLCQAVAKRIRERIKS
jgi:hypothetical protein